MPIAVSTNDAAVVCLPAALSGAVQWQNFKQSWIGRPMAARAVMTPDLVAEGASVPEEPREETFANLLAQEVDALARLVHDGSPVHLVGHSYGGVVALRFAHTFPERLRSLTLVEPVCFEWLRRSGPADLVAEVRGLKEQCRADLSARRLEAAERFVSYWAGRAFWQGLSPAGRDRAARGMTKVVVGWEEIWESPVVTRDGGLPVPVLVVSGTRSPAPSRWIARYCADEVFRGSRHQEIDNAGHFSPLSHAAELTGAIDRFIRTRT